MSLSLGATNRLVRSGLGPRLGGRSSSIFRLASVINAKPRFYATTLEPHSEGFVLKSDDSGTKVTSKFPTIWLRDNCRCPQCVNQDTLQRSFNTFETPEDIAPKEISPKENGVDVLWSDSHQSHYSWSWLNNAVKGAKNSNEILRKNGKLLWGAKVASNVPEVEYSRVMNDPDQKGMAKLTNNIKVWGFCFVTNSPKTPEATEKLLESIGPIRNTHYGGFYDFVPDLALADTAYTNLALPAHTDTTYFSEPVGLQAFHLLSHTPPPNKPADEALGGQSLLVDGFNVAYRLRKESLTHFNALRKTRIPWHASGNNGVAMAPDRAYPVIEADNHHFFSIRWNNDDRGVIPLDPSASDWYAAARKWDEILKRKENEYWFQLEPGRILIFDNWRVLHGRSAFEGLRRICGAYISRDDFISRWKTTNFPRDDVITANMQLR